MILPFSTQLNGKPTYFVEKIWGGLISNNLVPGYEEIIKCYKQEPCKIVGITPKIHTIREDKKERWEKGKLIDYFINNRTKNAFRFAPRIPVISTQTIFMSYAFDKIIEITIDGRYICDFAEKELIAKNDGFDSYEDFFNYFIPIIQKSENEFYVGKIIHWTDFKY